MSTFQETWKKSTERKWLIFTVEHFCNRQVHIFEQNSTVNDAVKKTMIRTGNKGLTKYTMWPKSTLSKNVFSN